MGKYIDAIENSSFDDFNLSLAPDKDDYVTDIVQTSKNSTNDALGTGIIVLLFASIFTHISKQENGFQLNYIQALVSTSVLIFSISLFLLLLGLTNSVQLFAWSVLAIYLLYVVVVFRTHN
ncbi:MAG: hypothetical protein ACOC56_01300 [Atribacterota bacterium]